MSFLMLHLPSWDIFSLFDCKLQFLISRSLSPPFSASLFLCLSFLSGCPSFLRVAIFLFFFFFSVLSGYFSFYTKMSSNGALTIKWSRSMLRARSARSRSRSRRSASIAIIGISEIGTVLVTDEIAIVVRRCGSFRLARCVGRSSEALREAVRVWERSACEREEEMVFRKIRTDNDFSRFWLNFWSNWKYFQFDRIYHANQTPYFPENDFQISFSVKTNGALDFNFKVDHI